eukprot:CAMPEP_0119336452 /NCGR_PEP_ID=MMETSP1333-20130426/91883_1 /TAXON_ID=418940 /ORGANISM="Scyphosphaera apsteinii, Strain RCC1455" /LENGTH=48 /DNA_ID= /DNA_START= /DNA_END= /DNA_ORIENTATION=
MSTQVETVMLQKFDHPAFLEASDFSRSCVIHQHILQLRRDAPLAFSQP